MEHIVAIIKQSKYCESVLVYDLNDLHGWWVSRQGSRMNYWGGAAVDSGKCCNFAGGGKCNCDKNDGT